MTPTDKLMHLNDRYLTKLKSDWFNNPQSFHDKETYLPRAIEWFKSTAVNDIQGWKIEKLQTEATSNPGLEPMPPTQAFAPATNFNEEEHDDLPF